MSVWIRWLDEASLGLREGISGNMCGSCNGRLVADSRVCYRKDIKDWWPRKRKERNTNACSDETWDMNEEERARVCVWRRCELRVIKGLLCTPYGD